ncbi:MAG: fumarate reductase subunit D [SAR324 cluster bacterium]|nr:fumarate reductase subunit D [SAR324 cluster bacterium]
MRNIKNFEALWWGLFSAGGVVAAFLVPIHIILSGLGAPLGWLEDSPQVYQLWPVRLYLFVLIALPLFHCAHRIYHTLPEIGLKVISKPLAVLCYGGSLVGTLVTVWVVASL